MRFSDWFQRENDSLGRSPSEASSGAVGVELIPWAGRVCTDNRSGICYAQVTGSK